MKSIGMPFYKISRKPNHGIMHKHISKYTVSNGIKFMLLAKYREKFPREVTLNNFLLSFSISIYNNDFKNQNIFLSRGIKRTTISV
jgi:hypothetical protein